MDVRDVCIRGTNLLVSRDINTPPDSDEVVATARHEALDVSAVTARSVNDGSRVCARSPAHSIATDLCGEKIKNL